MGILNASNGNNSNVSGSPTSNNSSARRPPRNSSDSLSALQSSGSEQWPSPSQTKHPAHGGMQGGSPHRMGSPSTGSNMRGKHAGVNQAHRFSQTNSRPSSRHHKSDLNPSSLSVDDPDAFPTLSSTSTKASSKKPHTKKAQAKDGTLQKENNSGPSNVMRSSSSPSPIPRRPASKLNNSQNSRALNANADRSSASEDIPSPKNVPWFDQRPSNKEYLNYRRDAVAHCNEKLSFYQS